MRLGRLMLWAGSLAGLGFTGFFGGCNSIEKKTFTIGAPPNTSGMT